MTDFRELQILETAEAAEYARRAAALRSCWQQRNETGLYFTMGAVSEEDARAGVEEYCRRARASNLLLLEHFGAVLDKVRGAVESLENAPVRLHPRFGLPGIMIYLSPGKPAIVVGNQPHVDLQHRLLEWGPHFEPRSDNLLSFTLALALPGEGAGLRTWPQFRNARFDRAAMTSGNATFLPYRTGVMILHDGLTPHHGVGMRTDGRRDDLRITLQGFGARVNGEWLLYW